MKSRGREDWMHTVRELCRRGVCWSERYVPRGLRSLVGIILMIAGVFGFLPIVGFWMVPLGVAFIALDIPPLRRRLHRWLAHEETSRRS